MSWKLVTEKLMASYSVVTSSGQTLVNILHRVRGLSSNSRRAASPHPENSWMLQQQRFRHSHGLWQICSSRCLPWFSRSACWSVRSVSGQLSPRYIYGCMCVFVGPSGTRGCLSVDVRDGTQAIAREQRYNGGVRVSCEYGSWRQNF